MEMEMTKNPAREKLKALQSYINQYEKKGNGKAVIAIGADLDLKQDYIVPPMVPLQKLLGRDTGEPGGFPVGKYSVIAGPEKTGKSTLLLQTVASDLDKNKDAIWAWIDAENAFDEVYANRFGIDMERLIIIKGSTLEDQLQRIIDLTKAKLLRGVVVDSIGALVPRAEMEDSKGNEHELNHVGMLDLQRKMGQFFRMSNGSVDESKCAIIMIAHVYQDINSHGAPFVVKGGNALKHWGHVRLMFTRLQDKSTVQDKILPDGTREKIMTGHDVKIKLDKTRQNDKEGQFVVIPFRYGIGFDCLESAIQVGIKIGVIVRSGPMYAYGEHKHKGYDTLVSWFKNNPSELDGLVLAIQRTEPTIVNESESTGEEE